MGALRGKIFVLTVKLNKRGREMDCTEGKNNKGKNGGVSGFLVHLVLQYNGKDIIFTRILHGIPWTVQDLPALVPELWHRLWKCMEYSSCQHRPRSQTACVHIQALHF